MDENEKIFTTVHKKNEKDAAVFLETKCQNRSFVQNDAKLLDVDGLIMLIITILEESQSESKHMTIPRYF